MNLSNFACFENTTNINRKLRNDSFKKNAHYSKITCFSLVSSCQILNLIQNADSEIWFVGNHKRKTRNDIMYSVSWGLIVQSMQPPRSLS